VFVLKNQEAQRRELFVEMDMAAKQFITKISNDRRLTLRFKFEQYDPVLAEPKVYADLCQLRNF